MKSLLKFILVLCMVLYPFIVFIGIKSLPLQYLGLFTLLTFVLRFFVLKKSNDKIWLYITSLGITLSIAAIFIDSVLIMQLYPVAVSLALLGVFGYSLFQEQSLVTTIAKRMSKKELPSFAITYTWFVTLAWCIFFIINACISIFTLFFCSIDIWAIYNGFISYILIAVFMVLEIVVRFFVRRYFEKNS